MSNLPEQVAIPIDNTQPTDGNVLLGVVFHHVKNASKHKYVLEWAVIRHPPKGRTCGGGINVIKRNEPPKTETLTWPSAPRAYGIALTELSSFEDSYRRLQDRV